MFDIISNIPSNHRLFLKLRANLRHHLISQSHPIPNQVRLLQISKSISPSIRCLRSKLGFNEFWSRSSTSDKNGTTFNPALTDDSSLSIISDENTNINMNFKNVSNSINLAKRNPNVLHSILSQQRPIAPKNDSLTPTKGKDDDEGESCTIYLEKKKQKKTFSYFLVTSTSPPSLLPLITSSPTTDTSFYSPTNHSMQPFRKNFQCRMCRLTYKVNCSLQENVRTFDCTFYRIFMIVPHISVKNMKSVMHKQVVTLKNSTRMLHYHHRQLEIINFV